MFNSYNIVNYGVRLSVPFTEWYTMNIRSKKRAYSYLTMFQVSTL